RGCSGAVPGSSLPSFAGRPTAVTRRRNAATLTSASAISAKRVAAAPGPTSELPSVARCSMLRSCWLLVLLVTASVVPTARAEEAAVAALLSRPLLSPQLPFLEVQSYLQQRIPEVP